MNPRIGVHLIFGAQPEPFLEAALRSVQWADYVCAVNSAPEEAPAAQNEAVVRRVVPADKLRLSRLRMAKFSFSQARNAALALADDDDYVLILDSDDVHYPGFERIARWHVDHNYDMVTAHFWHLAVYKDLWKSEPHREILFTKEPGVQFEKSVHEALVHPRRSPALADDYHYVHYGYIKPPREVFRRWKLYSDLEGDPHHYDGRNPDDALVGWAEDCQPFWRKHPPAAQKTLEAYPPAPQSVRSIEASCNIGLVMLTWDDAKNLRSCLPSLATTRQPFHLTVVDNGSTDDTYRLLAAARRDLSSPLGAMKILTHPGTSLAQALNIGFRDFMKEERDHPDDPQVDYIGWVHPDMIFERDTWLECLRHVLDTHPDIVKVGASDLNAPIHPEPTPGNSQCYLVRKSALQQIGLFDEGFEACGGYEDWEINHRLLSVGRVMIWPDALVRHNSMGTRSRHDNEEAARRNAERYHQLVGQWEAVV